MKLFHLKTVKKNKIGAPIFTGTVVRQSPFADTKNADVSVDYIYFPKGVKNNFHKHSNDQVLIMTKGRGIIATKSKKIRVKPGDVVWIPAGEVHWHGADANSSFTHISVTRSGTTIELAQK